MPFESRFGIWNSRVTFIQMTFKFMISQYPQIDIPCFQVRIMEQKLAWSQQSDPNNVQIHRLEGEVEEQRQLRLHDARQVEAKAARIKEWVTNKLRELEQQNQTLREQNIKCNQQLELLRNHLALADRRRSESCSPEPRQHTSTANSTRSNRHRRHQSVCLSSNFEPAVPSTLVTSVVNFGTSNSSMDPLTDELRAAVDNLSIGRVPSSSASDPDLAHDYAEIYTPSREKVPWPRAPTPPIHRFPSWEDRIYQVNNIFQTASSLHYASKERSSNWIT